eukprot:gene9693-6936_t
MRNYDLDDDDDAIIKQLMKDRPIASLGNSKLGDKPAVPVANEDASLFTVGEYASIAEATMASRIPATPTAVTGRGVGGQSDQVTPTEQVSASALAAAARAAKQKALEKRLKETFGLGTKEENLGTNFFLTPWVAPAFDRADEFRRSQLFRRGDTEGGNISLVSSPDLGLGVRLYFQFLISMSIGLAAMFVLSLPLLLFSAFSSGMPPQSRDAAGLYRFGLGNMGYQGPAAYNNFISEPHVCDRARYAASDQTCVSVVGFEFSLRQVHLTLTGCEFLQVVVLLLVVRHLQNRLERLCRPDKAENLVSITHYAVYVDNLPPFVTAEEVIAHFSALYQLQNVDWRDRLPVEDARPVQSVDNSGLQMHAGSWVAECTLYRRVGPLLRAYRSKEPLLHRLVRSRAQMKRFAHDTPHPLGPDEARFDAAEMRMLTVAREVDAFFADTRRQQLRLAQSYRQRRARHLWQRHVDGLAADAGAKSAKAPPAEQPLPAAAAPQGRASAAAASSVWQRVRLWWARGVAAGPPPAAQAPCDVEAPAETGARRRLRTRRATRAARRPAAARHSAGRRRLAAVVGGRRGAAAGVPAARHRRVGRRCGAGGRQPPRHRRVVDDRRAEGQPPRQPPRRQPPRRRRADRRREKGALAPIDEEGGDTAAVELAPAQTTAADFVDVQTPLSVEDADVVGAFVVFEYNESLARCLEDYAAFSRLPLSLFYPPQLRIQGRRPRVRRAPEPDQILFENLEYSDALKRLLALRTALVTALLLLVCFAAVFLGASLRQAYAQRLPSAALCDLAVPALYAPHYAADTAALRRLGLVRPPLTPTVAGDDAPLNGTAVDRRALLDGRCAALRADGAAFFAVYAEAQRFAAPAVRYSFAGCLSNASALQDALLLDGARNSSADFDWRATQRFLNGSAAAPLTVCPRYTARDVNMSLPYAATDAAAAAAAAANDSRLIGTRGLFCPCLSLRAQAACELAPCQLGHVAVRSDASAANDSAATVTVAAAAQCEVPAGNIAACFCASQTGAWLQNGRVLRLLGRLFTRQSAAEALRSTDSEASHCADYAATLLSARLVEYGLVLVTVAVNRLLKLALVHLTRYEGHASLDDAQRSVLLKLFVATFANTAGVVLLAYALRPPGALLSHSDSQALAAASAQYAADKQRVDRWLFAHTGLRLGPYTDFSRDWFGAVGFYFATTLVFSSLGPLLTPLLTLTVAKPLARRLTRLSLAGDRLFHSCLRRLCAPLLPRSVAEPLLQRELDALLLGAPFLFTAHAAQVLALLAVALSFAAGLPLLPLLALLLALCFLRLDVFLLLRVSRRPPALDERIFRAVFAVLGGVAVLRLVVGLLMFSQPQILDPAVFWDTVGLSARSLPGALRAGRSSSLQRVLDALSLRSYLTQLARLRAATATFLDALPPAGAAGAATAALRYLLLQRALQPTSFPLAALLCVVLATHAARLLWRALLLPASWAGRRLRGLLAGSRRTAQADVFAASREKGYVHPFELVAAARDPVRCEAAPFTGIYYQFLQRRAPPPSDDAKDAAAAASCWARCCACCRRKKKKTGAAAYALETPSAVRSAAAAAAVFDGGESRRRLLKPQEERDGWEVAEMGLDFLVKVCTWTETVARDAGDAQAHLRGQHKRTFEVLRQYRVATFRLEEQPHYRAAWLALRDETQSSLAADYAAKMEDFAARPRRHFNPKREEQRLWHFLVQRWLRGGAAVGRVAVAAVADADDDDSLHLDDKLAAMREQKREQQRRLQAEAEELALQRDLLRASQSRKEISERAPCLASAATVRRSVSVQEISERAPCLASAATVRRSVSVQEISERAPCLASAATVRRSVSVQEISERAPCLAWAATVRRSVSVQEISERAPCLASAATVRRSVSVQEISERAPCLAWAATVRRSVSVLEISELRAGAAPTF